jgi:hypothetical protein
MRIKQHTFPAVGSRSAPLKRFLSTPSTRANDAGVQKCSFRSHRLTKVEGTKCLILVLLVGHSTDLVANLAHVSGVQEGTPRRVRSLSVSWR